MNDTLANITQNIIETLAAINDIAGDESKAAELQYLAQRQLPRDMSRYADALAQVVNRKGSQ